ncbi:lipoyl(octanoyl) transferase LipB [Curtobacterium sp. 24E2]
MYTAGRRTEPADLPTNGAPVVDVDRGGRITWHGPGQLVAYPIVRLAVPIDVVAWVRDLEQVIIDAAATVGVDARRIDGRSGAWTSSPTTGAVPTTGSPPTTGASPAKVGAIGLHVAEGVTTHGIAINCDNALDAYAAIVPCGIADAGVTTLSAAAGHPVTVSDLADVVVDRIRAAEHGMRSGDRISRAARSAASISTAATSTAATSTAPARQETLV